MRRVIILASFCATVAFGAQPNSIVVGETYEIKERDLLAAIEKHIADNKDAIEARLKAERDKAREKIAQYKPKDLTAPLPRATEDRVFTPDMSYTVPEDIKDARGVIVYPKGYKYNPLDYHRLKSSYVVIDATDKLQTDWLKASDYLGKTSYQIWITNGSFIDAAKAFRQRVYFVSQPLTDRFQLQRTPSVISQFGNRVTVREICIDCNKTVTEQE